MVEVDPKTTTSPAPDCSRKMHAASRAAAHATTITLSEERYRALKEVAARRGQTITEVVDQALELAGVNTLTAVRDMLAQASGRAGLRDDDAMEMALRETAALRSEGGSRRTA